MLFRKQKLNIPDKYNLSIGITMIELLVVCAILGLLAAALVSAIDPVAQIERGRDSRRIADIKAMQSAFEQFYTLGDGNYNLGGSPACTAMAQDLLPNNRLPEPPSGDPYTCQANGTNGYCICAELQNNAMRDRYANSEGPNCNYDANGASIPETFYCLENLQ